MKFFLDTADIEQIKNINELGLVDGVTTNPSIIAASGRKINDVISDITNIVKGPVSAECMSVTYDEIIKEANILSKIAPNVAIKLPLTPIGLKACKNLSERGIMVNVTLCFNATGALLAAKSGATFISPFVGRHDDYGWDGMEMIQEIRQIYDNYGFDTEILAASIRTVNHIKQAALIGADVITCPPKLIMDLYKHPYTDIGIAKFEEDMKKANLK